MPRALRVEYPGAHYHTMCRGNNGGDIFFTDDGRRLFLSTLTEVCEQAGWKIHAYCLMHNHYHLLMETPEANLVEGMKWFQGAYTQRVNAMFHRRGHLFQGRYKAIPVETNPRSAGLTYFRQVSTYIHLNPFRAKLCGEGLADPLESYLWSSYPAYCGKQRKRPVWLERQKVLKTWGFQEGATGASAGYRRSMERYMRMEIDPFADCSDLFEKQVKRGWYIGSEEFRKKLDHLLEGKAGGDNLRGAQRPDHGREEAERLLGLGLAGIGWKEAELLAAKSVQIEKQAIAWLMKTHTTVTGAWLAERLEMGHPVNASRAIGRFRNATDRQTKKLKKEMLRCVG